MRIADKIVLHTSDELAELAAHVNNIGTQLTKFDQQQKRWLQDIAHELRTPLTVIRSDVEAMVDEVLPANQSNLALLQKDVLRLNRLIDDLHELSVTDTVSLQLHCEPIDFAKLLFDIAERFKALFVQADKTLECHVEPVKLMADENRLVQVMNNLLENCLRYTEQQGTIYVSCVQSGTHAEIVVEDSGPGVEPSQLSHLFERLYCVESSRNREKGGSGLGLAICQNIIVGHKGSIVAELSQYGGLAIRITLPLNEH